MLCEYKNITVASSPCSFYQEGPAVRQQCLRKPWNCSTSIKNAISPVQRTELHTEIKRKALKCGEGNSKKNEEVYFCILFWFLYFFSNPTVKGEGAGNKSIYLLTGFTDMGMTRNCLQLWPMISMWIQANCFSPPYHQTDLWSMVSIMATLYIIIAISEKYFMVTYYLLPFH